MSGKLERKIINICIAKLRDIGRRSGAWRSATAITRVTPASERALYLDHFSSQSASPLPAAPQPATPQPATPRLLHWFPCLKPYIGIGQQNANLS